MPDALTPTLPIISATALDAFERCERQFDLRYRQRLRWPDKTGEGLLSEAPPEVGAELGKDFHHLVRLHASGMPSAMIQSLLDKGDRPYLLQLWQAYLLSEYSEIPLWSRDEQAVFGVFADTMLVARFDRLTKTGDRWTIYDWKTGKRFEREQAEKGWQTSLYPFLLVESGPDVFGEAIAPEQIEMIYWHVPKNDIYRFRYTAEAHEKTRQKLEIRLPQLNKKEEFTPNPTACSRCAFEHYCSNLREKSQDEDAIPLPLFDP